MQMMYSGGGLAALAPDVGTGGMNKSFFLFTGDSLSLQARIDNLTT